MVSPGPAAFGHTIRPRPHGLNYSNPNASSRSAHNEPDMIDSLARLVNDDPAIVRWGRRMNQTFTQLSLSFAILAKREDQGFDR
jgi:hypothetical protein